MKKTSRLITQLEALSTIEIPLTTAREYSLKDQVILRNHPIYSIVAFSGGKTKDGSIIADPSNAYLDLREIDGRQQLIELPLKAVLYTPGYPVLQFLQFPDRAFDWLKSRVTFADAPTAGQVLQLMVLYDPDRELEQMGADRVSAYSKPGGISPVTAR